MILGKFFSSFADQSPVVWLQLSYAKILQKRKNIYFIISSIYVVLLFLIYLGILF